MSKGVRTILGVAAAIAIPYAAPAISSFIGLSGALAGALGSTAGTVVGSGLVGGVLGTAAAVATRQNPLLGFAGGALGGGFGGYMQGAPAAAGAGGAGGGTASPSLPPGGSAVPVISQAAPPPAAPPPPSLLSRIGTGITTELTQNPFRSLATTGQLAMTLYNRPPEQLLPHEQQQVQELAGLAQTNRQLYDQRLREAQEMIRMGAPRPEQAFAQAQGQVQRQVAETARGRPAGLRAAAVRGGAIEATRLGTLAAAQDAETAMRTRAAGLAAMPAAAPATAGMLSAPIYEGQQRREAEYQRDVAQAFGNIAGLYGGPTRERIIEYRPAPTS